MDIAFYLALALMLAGYLSSHLADVYRLTGFWYKVVDTVAAGLFIGGVLLLIFIAFMFGVLNQGI